MKTSTLSASLMRQELEEFWRSRFEAAQADYQAASKQYRNLMQGLPDGLPPRDFVALAREPESRALAKYTRILHIFIELTTEGKVPEEAATEGSDGK